MNCEILNLGSTEWKKGKAKVKFSVEFYVEPEEVEEITPKINDPDSLDDLRKELNQDNSYWGGGQSIRNLIFMLYYQVCRHNALPLQIYLFLLSIAPTIQHTRNPVFSQTQKPGFFQTQKPGFFKKPGFLILRRSPTNNL